jgi:hypothetical protein
MKTFMQVIYRGTYWFHFWSQMQKAEDDKELIKTGWRFTNRICS